VWQALALSLFAGQIYSWTDASGTVHYTDDPATIPKAAKVQKTEGQPITTIEAPPAAKPAPRAAERAPRSDPKSGAGSDAAAEQRWRARFREAKEKIAALEAQIDADTKIVGDDPLVVYGRMRRRRVYDQNAEIVARRERNKKELERAKAALDDLERRASNENVPREWRQ
jgi:hypothetical protein